MNILVGGARGRMGKEILSLIDNDDELNFVCGFGTSHDSIRKYSDL